MSVQEWKVTPKQIAELASVSDFQYKIIVGYQTGEGLVVGIEVEPNVSPLDMIEALGAAATVLGNRLNVPFELVAIALASGVAGNPEEGETP